MTMIIKSIKKDDAYYPDRKAIIGLKIKKSNLHRNLGARGWLAGSVVFSEKVKISRHIEYVDQVYFYGVKVVKEE